MFELVFYVFVQFQRPWKLQNKCAIQSHLSTVPPSENCYIWLIRQVAFKQNSYYVLKEKQFHIDSSDLQTFRYIFQYSLGDQLSLQLHFFPTPGVRNMSVLENMENVRSSLSCWNHFLLVQVSSVAVDRFSKIIDALNNGCFRVILQLVKDTVVTPELSLQIVQI